MAGDMRDVQIQWLRSEALTQRESLQPQVVAVTVTSKKVRSLLVLGVGKQFISSFSGNR